MLFLSLSACWLTAFWGQCVCLWGITGRAWDRFMGLSIYGVLWDGDQPIMRAGGRKATTRVKNDSEEGVWSAFTPLVRCYVMLFLKASLWTRWLLTILAFNIFKGHLLPETASKLLCLMGTANLFRICFIRGFVFWWPQFSRLWHVGSEDSRELFFCWIFIPI